MTVSAAEDHRIIDAWGVPVSGNGESWLILWDDHVQNAVAIRYLGPDL